MAKRIASTAASLAVIVCLLVPSLSVSAYSAEELYNDCDIVYEQPYDEEDINTISNYNYAKRYATMFRYVADSEYDSTIIETRISTYEAEIERLRVELLSGFSKTVDEIYQLESDYNTAMRQLSEALSLSEPVEIDYKRITAEDVPSYEQYVKALNRKRTIDKRCVLGSEKSPQLSLNAELVKDYDSTSVTYATIEGSGVTSLYNGKVAGIGEDHVTINHYNGIVSSYKGE